MSDTLSEPAFIPEWFKRGGSSAAAGFGSQGLRGEACCWGGGTALLAACARPGGGRVPAPGSLCGQLLPHWLSEACSVCRHACKEGGGWSVAVGVLLCPA